MYASTIATETITGHAIPVLVGLQAQGDLLIIPADTPSLARVIVDETTRRPLTTHEVIRGESGRNAHTLLAAPDAATIADITRDPTGLALVALTVNDGREAQLHHVEHGSNLIGPGDYVIRRQQELTAAGMRQVAD